jgi:HSP20 family molecular chaperone IbpA|tara:strand:+ start:261 stop:713 length:453 start_codon:yes stop_codon:yes gene_type:complete
MNAITLHRPGLLAARVFSEVFDELFETKPVAWNRHLDASTSGYPVTDIYRDDDGSTVLEFALAGFKKKDIVINVHAEKRSITVSSTVEKEDGDLKPPSVRRIARRNFTKSFVNYDDNLDLLKAEATFKDGLLVVKLPLRPESKPTTISIK